MYYVWLTDPASAFYQQASPLTRAYSSLSLLSMIPTAAFAFYALFKMVCRQPKAVSLIHLGVTLFFFRRNLCDICHIPDIQSLHKIDSARAKYTVFNN